MRKWYLASSPRPRAELAGRERRQGIGVAEHRDGLPERAHQVLALGQVHARSCRRWRRRPCRAAWWARARRARPGGSGRGEPGHVGDEPPADRDHDVGAGQAPRGPGPAERLDGRERLGRLAVADLERAVLPTGSTAKPMPGWVTIAARRRAGGQHLEQAVAGHPCPRAPGRGSPRATSIADHADTFASWASTSSAIRSAIARFGFSSVAWNGSTSTVTSATSAYSRPLACSRSRTSRGDSSSSSGRCGRVATRLARNAGDASRQHDGDVGRRSRAGSRREPRAASGGDHRTARGVEQLLEGVGLEVAEALAVLLEDLARCDRRGPRSTRRRRRTADRDGRPTGGRRWSCRSPSAQRARRAGPRSRASPRREARGCGRVSPTESPPNLRVASSASTSATIVSATTPMAGTAVTSVRSLNDTVSSLVAVSTVLSVGRLSVASGFMAARATSTSPVEMPPSMPPARPTPAGRCPRPSPT